MEKINIAELLKDCPKGMELDCIMYDNVTLKSVSIGCGYPIEIATSSGFSTRLTKYGQNVNIEGAKCVIFPKGKTTWEGFVPPCQFKDGDILVGKSGYPFIFKSLNNMNGCCSYCGIDCLKNFKLDSNDWTFADSLRFASEKEKEKLFKIIKDNGYKWNSETKSLEKLIAPKFKNGDRIKDKNNKEWFVGQVFETHFDISSVPNAEGYFVSIEDQDNYELVPDKFNITELKPFDKVLVKFGDVTCWKAEQYSHYDNVGMPYSPFCCIGSWYDKCIPYKGNEHLLGTDDDCDEYYKNWN